MCQESTRYTSNILNENTFIWSKCHSYAVNYYVRFHRAASTLPFVSKQKCPMELTHWLVDKDQLPHCSRQSLLRSTCNCRLIQMISWNHSQIASISIMISWRSFERRNDICCLKKHLERSLFHYRPPLTENKNAMSSMSLNAINSINDTLESPDKTVCR